MKTPRLALVLCVMPAAGAVGCDDGIEPPGPYVSLQELDQTQQPTTQPLGVLLDVVASGGTVVRLEALGGVFANGNTSTLCINFANSGINTTVVSVVPAQTEALVNAYLGNRGTMNAAGGPADTGSPLAEPADAGPVDATGADSGLVDATADAGASDATAPAVTMTPAAAFLRPLDPGCVATSFVAEQVSASMVVSIGRAPAAPITSTIDSGIVVDASATAESSVTDDAADSADVESSVADEAADAGDVQSSTDAPTGDTADGSADGGLDDGGDAS